jgi:hypothetical protein
MSVLEISANLLMWLGFILIALQVLVIFRPLSRKIYTSASNFLVKRFMKMPRYQKNGFNFHYSTLNRFQLQRVYGEILKDDTRVSLTLLEFFQIMRYVTKTAEIHNVEPSDLFTTVEHIDGRGDLLIHQVADLLSQNISVKEITDKTRRGYSFEQIIETKGVPVEWTDAIFNKGSNYRSNPLGGF